MNSSNSNITDTPPTMHPAVVPQTLSSGLTIAFTAAYGVMFLVVYVQLWMVLFFKHRRLSYQSVFLFLCLAWAGLRTTLFSFYFNETSARITNSLSTFLYWLLFCLPICLQFTTLCLLVLFFAQVVFKARCAKYEPNKFKLPIRCVIGTLIVLFLAVNAVCAILYKQFQSDASEPSILPKIRVVINEVMFLSGGIALAICIYKVSKITSANLVLEAKGTTFCQAMTACVFIILLYISKAVWNILAVFKCFNTGMPSFGYDWLNVSDQADGYDLSNNKLAYISFGIVLLVWEYLPTFIVIIFFRVHRPTSSVNLADLSTQSGSRAYFFDNPRRYDSDEDLSTATRGSQFDVSSHFIGSGGHLAAVNQSGSVPRSFSDSYLTPSGSYPTRSHHIPPNSTGRHFYDGT